MFVSYFEPTIMNRTFKAILFLFGSCVFFISCQEDPDPINLRVFDYNYIGFPDPDVVFYRIETDLNTTQVPTGLPIPSGQDSAQIMQEFFTSIDSTYDQLEMDLGIEKIRFIGDDDIDITINKNGTSTTFDGSYGISSSQTLLAYENQSILLKGTPGDPFIAVELFGSVFFYTNPDTQERERLTIYRGISNPSLNNISQILDFVLSEDRLNYNLQAQDTIGIIYSPLGFELDF